MTDYWNKDILVLGCGNVLFGDDGFGPAVVEYLQKNFKIPSNVGVVNAGLSIREILFNVVLSENKPQKIIVVDAVDAGRIPGEIFEIDITEIPLNKIDDFSMHQLPTSNLLYELKTKRDIEVRILTVQVQNIPEEVSPGLSNTILESIPIACEKIFLILK